MNYLNGYDIYSNNDWYLEGYQWIYDNYSQSKGERHLSSGKRIKVFNNFEFEHSLDTSILVLLFV